jgi:hypothetical protein
MLIVGQSLDEAGVELQRLVSRTVARELRAHRIDDQADGDVRFWAVDETQSPVLAKLVEFGRREFQRATGSEPLFSFIMINAIDCRRAPNGSGGGWHRDSSRRQYKAFAYLTDVLQPEQGAFCYLAGSNSRSFWLASMVYRLMTGANRYSDRAIHVLTRLGARMTPVLLPAGVPFFVNTSLVHRGLPITTGRRVMATLYISEDLDRMSADFKEFYAADRSRRHAKPSSDVLAAAD